MKKLIKQGKYNNGQKASPTFYILKTFLIPITNKVKQEKEINFLQIVDKTRNSLLRCKRSYFALTNIRLHRNDSFLRFIL